MVRKGRIASKTPTASGCQSTKWYGERAGWHDREGKSGIEMCRKGRIAARKELRSYASLALRAARRNLRCVGCVAAIGLGSGR